jgi:hypothetical protein
MVTLALAGVAQAAGETLEAEGAIPAATSGTCDLSTCATTATEGPADTGPESAGTDTSTPAPVEDPEASPAPPAIVTEPADVPPVPVVEVVEPPAPAPPDSSGASLPDPPVLLDPPVESGSTDESAGRGPGTAAGDAPLAIPLGSMLENESLPFPLSPFSSPTLTPLSRAATAAPARLPGESNDSRRGVSSRTGSPDGTPYTPDAPRIPTGPSAPSPAPLSGGGSGTSVFFTGFAALVAALSFGAARRQSRRLIPAVAVWRPVALVSPLERPG